MGSPLHKTHRGRVFREPRSGDRQEQKPQTVIDVTPARHSNYPDHSSKKDNKRSANARTLLIWVIVLLLWVARRLTCAAFWCAVRRAAVPCNPNIILQTTIALVTINSAVATPTNHK